MAWQNIYGILRDDTECGERTTHSMRGMVKSIDFDLLTGFGKAICVGAWYKDGKEKILRPDLRRVPKPKRKEIYSNYLEEVNNNTKVKVNIDIVDNEHFDFALNGVQLPQKLLNILRNEEKLKELLCLMEI